MSAIKVERGPGQNPWLFHVFTVADCDEYLSSSAVRNEPEVTDRLLDARNELSVLEAPA